MEKPKRNCCKSKTKDKNTVATDDIVENIIESTFKLRRDLGVSKITFNDGQSISQTYAPDSTCIGFLKANPNRITMFEKYPDNWLELIKDNESEIENE